MANKPTSSSTRLLVSDGEAAPTKLAGSRAPTKRASIGGALTKLQLGFVTVEVKAPTKAEIRRDIVAGQLALARALPRLLTPGVVLDQRPGVPLYHADPNLPGKIIRELNGMSQSGTFLNGKFRPSK